VNRSISIAIIGGGIGGCATALSLHDAGFTNVTVYEAAREVQEVGVGINVLPHAVRELTELGLADQLAAKAVETGELSYHNRFGQQIWVEQRGRAAGYQWPQFSIHRAELHNTLYAAAVERLGTDCIRLGHRMSAADADALGADVVIAADGVHSALRAALAPEEGGPLWNGVTMWRGATVAPPFLGGRRMVMTGVLTHRMVIYPVRDLPDGRQLINWVAEKQEQAGGAMPKQAWDVTSSPDEPLHYFGDFSFDWLDIPALIRHAPVVLKYPMVDRDALSTWRRGNCVLMGDAAHPMYPVGSNGASQAILDARVLARHLALKDSLDDALTAYEAERLPATAAVVKANRSSGPERSMEIVAERAPNGFADLNTVISQEELTAISDDYKRVAGFDPNQLNQRASLSVR
jgi:5-methylphenazine-1-carboxylate 1-monooxygenase